MSKIVTMAPFNVYPAPKEMPFAYGIGHTLQTFEAHRLIDKYTHKGRRITIFQKYKGPVAIVRKALPANPTHEERLEDAFATFYEIDNECGSKSIAYSVIERAHGREIAELVAAET